MQRTRAVAGLSLACVASLTSLPVILAFLAFLAVQSGNSFGAGAESLFALATFVLAATSLGLLLARNRAARIALERSERRYRELVEELPLVTYTARVFDSTVEYVSPQIERLLEITAEQALEEQDFWTARLHALDREHVLRDWRAWCADPTVEPFRRSYRMVTESGRVIWVDDVTILVGDRTGVPLRFQRQLLDVSEQRLLEEQLREAQKFDALGRLAGGVAHDFNNLLAVISGYAERLAFRLPERAERESAIAIGAAADRGTALVRQLLAFSRPQASDRRLVDLNALVAEFVPMLRRVIGEDIELELAFERHPLPVEVDPARIDQVLMNLVVNARDAMPAGGRLTIATAAVGADEPAGPRLGHSRTALVTVTDTGVGMDPETRARIFEPYFTTKELGKASGLGLATVFGIVKQAGGAIAVSSAPGLGTTFGIHLPRAAGELQPTIEPIAESPGTLGGPETVLLVEDEAALRELEQLMLEEAGYRVHSAADAVEALELAGRHSFDLLVVDVVMPGMSGPQLAEELRARGFDLPTIFVSGYDANEFASRGLHAGTSAVVQKPFQADTLLAKVREVLDDAAVASVMRPMGARLSDQTAGPPVRTRAETSLVVRCLACSTLYRKPVRYHPLVPGCCPRCDYVGWVLAD